MSTTPTLRTISQFCARNPAFTPGGVRWLRYNSETNGFGPAFVKVVGRVLVHEEEFFRVIAEQNGRNASGEQSAP